MGGKLSDEDDLLDALFDSKPPPGASRSNLLFLDDDELGEEEPAPGTHKARSSHDKDDDTEETPPTLIAAEASRRASLADVMQELDRVRRGETVEEERPLPAPVAPPEPQDTDVAAPTVDVVSRGDLRGPMPVIPDFSEDFPADLPTPIAGEPAESGVEQAPPRALEPTPKPMVISVTADLAPQRLVERTPPPAAPPSGEQTSERTPAPRSSGERAPALQPGPEQSIAVMPPTSTSMEGAGASADRPARPEARPSTDGGATARTWALLVLVMVCAAMLAWMLGSSLQADLQKLQR